MRLTFVALAVCIATAPALGQDVGSAGGGATLEKVKSIEALAGRELVLEPAEARTFSALIPVRVVPPKVHLKLHTLAVLRGGQLLDPGLVQLEEEAGSPVPRLVLTAQLEKLRRAGVYTVKVQVEPADPSGPPQLEFTLTRPAAELRLSSPLRLECVTTFWGGHEWSPIDPTLNESGGKSPLTLDLQHWICDLHGAGGTAAGRVKLKLPAAIERGGQGSIQVEEAAGMKAPALGKSAGTLVVRSEQLATGVFEAPFDVTSRVTQKWLLAMIFAGIVVGYVVRVVLEGKRLKQQAGVLAQERSESLQAALGKARDAALRQDLEAIAAALEAEIQKATATPATIEAAARGAETALADRLRRFAEQEAVMRGKIATLRTDLGQPTRQPPRVAEILAQAKSKLTEADGLLTEDNPTAAQASLDDAAAILDRLSGLAAEWRPVLAQAVDFQGAWAQTPLPAAIKAIEDHLGELTGKQDTKGILQSAAQLQADLKSGLLETAIPAVIRQAGEVKRRLAAGQSAAALVPLQQAIDAAESARGRASPENLGELTEKVALLHESVVAALQGAIPPPPAGQPAAAPLNGLAEGKFLAALEDVLARRAPAARGIALEVTRDTVELEPAPPRAAALPTDTTWDIALSAPSVAVSGLPLSVRLRTISHSGLAPAIRRVRWYVNDHLIQDGESRELTLSQAPAGTLILRAEATSRDDERRVARLTVPVRRAEAAPTLADLVWGLRLTELLITLISAILIAVAGFLLYQNAFIGTWGDLATAFFWGFSTDIGLAKVRELGGPLASRLAPPAAPPARA